MSNVIETKTFRFAIRIVNLYKYLTADKKEYILSKQLLRSGTSIGANVSEAQKAQSKPDFYAKMSIALKEANETFYWLRLLKEAGYLSNNQFDDIVADADEIISILTAICKNTKLK